MGPRETFRAVVVLRGSADRLELRCPRRARDSPYLKLHTFDLALSGFLVGFYSFR